MLVLPVPVLSTRDDPSYMCYVLKDAIRTLGWKVALDEGAFGHFDDTEKRKWAAAFAEELLSDPKVRIAELPVRLQREMITHVAVILVHLAETAFNHCRFHVAGVALRPALALRAQAAAGP